MNSFEFYWNKLLRTEKLHNKNISDFRSTLYCDVKDSYSSYAEVIGAFYRLEKTTNLTDEKWIEEYKKLLIYTVSSMSSLSFKPKTLKTRWIREQHIQMLDLHLESIRVCRRKYRELTHEKNL